MASPRASWSDDEVRATVNDYLAMLSDDASGKKYSKAAHRRALLPKLDPSRTEEAVEYKYSNISAAMVDLGLPYIPGYKPLGNYQAAIRVDIEQRLKDTQFRGEMRRISTELGSTNQETPSQRPGIRGRRSDSRNALVGQVSDVISESSNDADDEQHPGDAARLVVPTITDEATEGRRDRLGVDADARALAALVASRSLEPPLAIGLYGEWGSGKTFFMKRVQACVGELTAGQYGGAFRSDVAHVWFSAWHYAEGNLWASLLHQIFASLHPVKSRRQVSLDELMAKVEGAQKLTSAVEVEVEVATKRVDEAAAMMEEAKERNEKVLREAGELRARDLWDAVSLSASDQGLKDRVVKAADDMGLAVDVSSARELARATRLVIDMAGRTRTLAGAKPWLRSPLAYAVYAALLISILGLVLGGVVHVSHAWAGEVITTVAQLAAVGSAVGAWITRQGSLVRSVIAPAETLRERLEERLAEQRARSEREFKELELQLQAAGADLTEASERRVAAEQQLVIATTERAELKGKRLLRKYLAERADSGDYESYMGVIALAHRDLRDLSEYLRGAISDSDTSDNQPGRIVLYIDDLDRCDPNIVAEVLDAVHLLLAMPLFVVIVGVDPRWLERSLRTRHRDLLESVDPDPISRRTSAADYLEKIFQLTYTLPRMSADHCADLLIGAAGEIQAQSEANQPHDYVTGVRTDTQDSAERSEEAKDDEEPALVSLDDLAEALRLNEDDIKALRNVAPLVSTSPRRAKRFLNIYLVIRARVQGDPELREPVSRNRDASDIGSSASLLLLVALLLGLPLTMAKYVREMRQLDTGSTSLNQALIVAPEEAERWQEFLESAPPSLAVLPVGTVMRWLPLARPYLPLSLDEALSSHLNEHKPGR